MYLKQVFVRNRRVAGLLLFLLVLAVTVQVTGFRDHLSPQYLQHQLQENLRSGLSLFVLLFALGKLAQVPG